MYGDGVPAGQDVPPVFENDIPIHGELPSLDIKVKKRNRNALDLETFYGVSSDPNAPPMTDEEGKLIQSEQPKDHLWESLFLKRIAMFPTLDEAKDAAEKSQTPDGSQRWFEGTRPASIDAEVYHLDRLLIRMRDWAKEVAPMNDDLRSFCHRFSQRTLGVEGSQFGERRIDMIKKYVAEDWVASAVAYHQEEDRLREEAARDRIAKIEEEREKWTGSTKEFTNTPEEDEGERWGNENTSTLHQRMEAAKAKRAEREAAVKAKNAAELSLQLRLDAARAKRDVEKN